MKVLVVSTVPLEMNGIATVIVNYFRKLNDKIQFDFLISKSINESYKKELADAGSMIYVVDRKKDVITYIKQLKSIISNGNYDAIHVNGNSSTMILELSIAKKMGINKRIAHCHNTKCEHKIIHRLLVGKFNKCYTDAIACSKEAGEWIFGENNFTILPNGIDVKKYKYSHDTKEKKKKELNLGNNYIIGHVGLFNEQKNHEKLFQIFAEIKKEYSEAKLLCVSGSKTIPNNIKVLIETYKIIDDVIILQDRQDVAEIYQAMDLFVFPSKWEGLGIVTIEAQASGLYCIVSDKVPDSIDITSNVTHVCLDISAEKWAEIVKKHLNDNINRESMNDVVYNSIYEINSCANKLFDIYNEMN